MPKQTPDREVGVGRLTPEAVCGLLDLLQVIYLDACSECAVDPDPMDMRTMRHRVNKEGLSFLTISLPQFAKDLERCLADGAIAPKYFQGFRKYRSIPAFLRGMIAHLFDVETGELLHDSPRSDSYGLDSVVAAVRQICRSFSKLLVPCTPARERKSLRGFSETEQSLAAFEVHNDERSDFDRVSRLVWDPLFCNFDVANMIPSHGPGVSAERMRGNSKFSWRVWHERLEPYFPFLGFAMPLGAASSFSDEAIGSCRWPRELTERTEFDEVTFVSAEDESPSRVIAVPKTLKGPRIIAAEPLAAQYAQHAIQSYVCRAIENNWLLGRRINFRDQSVNQRLALEGSKTGRWATIDMSDASDRVYHDVAMSMFSGSPAGLSESISACRTEYAELPDGTSVGPLVKFATMGSALCFPVEAMYFYTICVVALLRKRSLQFDANGLREVGRDIFVYGDDLVVPSDDAAAVSDTLLKYNSKVNPQKSFWTGKFRESCGSDCYDGRLVTPTYVRSLLPTNRHCHTEIISTTAAMNAFYKRGYWRVVKFLEERISGVIGNLPIVSEDSPAIGRISFLPGYSVSRWNPDLMRFEIRAWVVEPVYQEDALEGYGALGKSLCALDRLDDQSDDVERDEFHLERSARHGVATLKRRAVAAR